MEDAEVFEATHSTVLQFVADGLVDGLRIDHIDGLLEPRRYLERLRAAVDARRPAADGARFPIVVEKILAPGETLPADWPVDGTTGYEFMTTLEDVFIDPAGYAQLESRYRGGRGEPDFHAVALDVEARGAARRRSTPTCAASRRCSRRSREQAEWPARPIAAYAGAIVELVAALPVYRTYIDAERPDADGRRTARCWSARSPKCAAARARRRRGVGGAGARAARCMARRDERAGARAARVRAAAAAAHRARSGEGGGGHGALRVRAARVAERGRRRSGVPVDGRGGAAARLLAARAERTPRALNATNTHDTKRSADVRSRLDALSEHAPSWERRLRMWRRRHRALQTHGARPARADAHDGPLHLSGAGRHLADRRSGAPVHEDATSCSPSCASGSPPTSRRRCARRR